MFAPLINASMPWTVLSPAMPMASYASYGPPLPTFPSPHVPPFLGTFASAELSCVVRSPPLSHAEHSLRSQACLVKQACLCEMGVWNLVDVTLLSAG
jgi:hypothetical protein